MRVDSTDDTYAEVLLCKVMMKITVCFIMDSGRSPLSLEEFRNILSAAVCIKLVSVPLNRDQKDPILKSLPVSFRIDVKVLLLVYKS